MSMEFRLSTERIDAIARAATEGPPHMGGEGEMGVIDNTTLESIHEIRGLQPVTALQQWIIENGGNDAVEAVRETCSDVTELTFEANPRPLRSPKSTAAAQRLLMIAADIAAKALSQRDGQQIQLMPGAAWRPPNATADDVSTHVGAFKRAYYRFQTRRHGNKVAAAHGDHLSLSMPWLHAPEAQDEITALMIEMTGHIRLALGALSMGLSAASPLYYYANGGQTEPIFGTALTEFESARLGQVWPGRTIMDVSGLYRDKHRFERTMRLFAGNGTLYSGRDVWLAVRAQTGSFPQGLSFEETCQDLGLNLSNPEDAAFAETLLHASFSHGPSDRTNPFLEDDTWRGIERWRQDMLDRIIKAPRNRFEVRTLESAPYFPETDDQPAMTNFEYTRALHAFLELVSIYISENPDLRTRLPYGEIQLSTAKSNETAMLEGGLDREMAWIARGNQTLTGRDLLGKMLEAIRPLAEGMSRIEDLEPIQMVADGTLQTPASRIRAEVGAWYDINVENRDNARLLENDDYPRELLQRTRNAIPRELTLIENDIPNMPLDDQPYISGLLTLVRKLQTKSGEPERIAPAQAATAQVPAAAAQAS